MIIDKIKYFVNYFDKNMNLKSVIDFLSREDLPSLEEGKYELENGAFVVVMSYDTKIDANDLESHKKYVDVQCVISGQEMVGFSSLDNCSGKMAYAIDKDIAFYSSTSTKTVALNCGEFAMFFPMDAHFAGKSVGTKTEQIKKVLVKIPVPLF